MKSIVAVVVASLLCALVTAAPECDAPGRHNATWGKRSGFDRLVYSVHPKLSAEWLRKQSTDVKYPPQGVIPDYKTITMVEVIDGMTDGSGGCAYLSNGGVGQYYVSLHLKTQRSKGLDFVVNVYAR